MPVPPSWEAGQVASRREYEQEVIQADEAARQAKSAIVQASGTEAATVAATIPALKTMPKVASSGAHVADRMASAAQYMASPTTPFAFGGKRSRGRTRGGFFWNNNSKNKSKKRNKKNNKNSKSGGKANKNAKSANANKNATPTAEDALIPVSSSGPMGSGAVGGSRRMLR